MWVWRCYSDLDFSCLTIFGVRRRLPGRDTHAVAIAGVALVHALISLCYCIPVAVTSALWECLKRCFGAYRKGAPIV